MEVDFMIKATEDFLKNIDILSENLKNLIFNADDKISPNGTTYFVSNSGNDNNDGLSPDTPWQTLEKVDEAKLSKGDGVCFKRGDLFRGRFAAKPGVSYFAYGIGDKPKFYSGSRNMADPSLWEIYDADKNIWKCVVKTPDVGSIVFNDGEFHSRKLIPSYMNGMFVCRDNPSKAFDIRNEMTCDLDVFNDITAPLSNVPSKGEDFLVPHLTDESMGDLYLRCDNGNPGSVFNSIELLERKHMIFVCGNDVTIDNLCLKYIGMHAICAGTVNNLKVSNCEIGWVGGCIQHYRGTDPNYPQGVRGEVTRFGNAVEIYGGCDNYEVNNNYIYQIYDCAITHQITSKDKIIMNKVSYHHNLMEYCVYGIEYFLDVPKENESIMSDIKMFDNIIRFTGYGWGQQRHNYYTPAHIKGWEFTNHATDYEIYDNIFDRSQYRMLQLVAYKQESLPKMYRNTYIQNLNGCLGQFGANAVATPPMITYDEKVDEVIADILNDTDSKVYYI